jgi:ABC-type transport system involved in multi-copper enzyme maturation permease subunit
MAIDVATAESADLPRISSHGPLRGLGGLTAAELRRWFPSRALAFALGGVGLVFAIYAIWVSAANAFGDPRLAMLMYPLYALWIAMLVLVMVAATQGAVANEIEDGTAAWVVAKPVGRPAFIVSKFVAAAPAVLIGAVLVPGIVARLVLQSAAARGDTQFSAGDVIRITSDRWARVEFTTLPDLAVHAGTLLLITVILFLVVAVMILLGCVIRSRAAIFLVGIAVPGLLLAFGLAGSENLVALTPAWAFDSLVATIGDNPAPLLGPLAVTMAWCVLILAVATWWFSRKEL